MEVRSRAVSFAIVALLAGFVASSAAWAATVKLTKQGPAKFGTTVVGYANGSIWPNPTYPVGTSKVELEEELGGDSFKVASSNTRTFKVGSLVNAWCADANHEQADTQTYTLGDIKKFRAVFGSSRANSVQLLANQRYAGIDTTEESVAFQLAIWAILYGTPDSAGKYSLSNATYSATLASDQAAIASLAQTWLDSLKTTASIASYKIRYFYVGTQPYTQNLIAFTK